MRLSLAEVSVVELPIVRHRVWKRIGLIARKNWFRRRERERPLADYKDHKS